MQILTRSASSTIIDALGFKLTTFLERTKTMVIIRPFTPDDYPGIAAVSSIIRPDMPITGDQLRQFDENRDAMVKFGRWVAEVDGHIVGISFHTQFTDMYHPRKLWVMVRVLPEHRRQGIGAALYTVMENSVQLLDPLALQVAIREDETENVRFAEVRGFYEYSRRWEALLDVATFDPTPYADLHARLAAEGIAIRSYADLVDDPQRDQKFHALQTEVDQDVPLPDPITPQTFEQFQREILQSSRFFPEATSFAVHKGEYVAMNALNKAGDNLWLDMTGTKAAYRRRGIALALKVWGIEFARAHGYKTIGVTNDVANTGMLAINGQLGFVRQPAMLQLQKVWE
ncbi:MAG: GNAT family N-acetyltransferase [Chitinophagaceae bacterium]|nr:GNAT family N-acetyltransferase [Anaerolineae bacterium]